MSETQTLRSIFYEMINDDDNNNNNFVRRIEHFSISYTLFSQFFRHTLARPFAGLIKSLEV